MRPLIRLFCSLSVVLTSFVVVDDAGAGAASGGTSSSTPCMAPPAAPDLKRPVIAVVYDATAGDGDAAIDAARTSAMSTIVNAGFTLDARLLIDTVGNDAANASQIVNTQLRAVGPNSLFRQNNATCKRHGIVRALQGVNRHAQPGPQDLLGAFQALASNLTGLTRRRVDLVIFSNMLNATEPIDVANPRPLARGITSLLNAVSREGLLPSCAGWEVYVVGAGVTARGTMPDVDYSKLRSLWSSFFERCGGQLVLYGDDLTQFPITAVSATTSTSKGNGDSNISQRQGTDAHGQTVVTFSLRASVLFATGSSTLAKSDAATLRELSSLLTTTYPRGVIDVTGYTDSTPTHSPGGNLSLSRKRAAAVAQWLTSHGVASRRVHSSGLGERNPIATNATPRGRARNRRVDVTVTLSRGADS